MHENVKYSKSLRFVRFRNASKKKKKKASWIIHYVSYFYPLYRDIVFFCQQLNPCLKL